MNLKHMESYTKLGLNIAYYRKLRMMTQIELAEKVNVGRSHISKIELSLCSVSLDVIFDIAEALEIPAYKLFEFRD